jgi:hypothetical protein
VTSMARCLVTVVSFVMCGHTALAQPSFQDRTVRRSCAQARALKDPSTDTIPQCLPRVELFADGNLKDVLGGGDSTKAVASGALGLHYQGNRYEVTGLVNVAGTNDTVVAGYGSTLLLPATGHGLNAASLSVRGRFLDWNDTSCARYGNGVICNAGWHLEANASARNWATSFIKSPPPQGLADTIRQVARVLEVPMWGVDADLWYSFFDAQLISSDTTSRRVSMELDVGIARRAIRGDIASAGNAFLRDSLLTSMRTNFTGLHVGLTLTHNDVRSAFTYCWLNGGVPGLSGGQIVATVELRSALVSGLLDRR